VAIGTGTPSIYRIE